jgi:hypothetical protein
MCAGAAFKLLLLSQWLLLNSQEGHRAIIMCSSLQQAAYRALGTVLFRMDQSMSLISSCTAAAAYGCE